MRTILFLVFALFFQGLSVAAPMQDRKLDVAALRDLGQALNIPADLDFVSELNKIGLRHPKQERWEMQELPEEQRLFVLDWAKNQGIYAEWLPSSDLYDKALILGATTTIMEKRLHYLIDLWEKGVRFKEIVWLTGDRPLDRSIDRLLEQCANESEAACFIWKQTSLPEEMRALPVVFVAVPMKQEETGPKRPNTQDTLVAWVDRVKEPCTALFISDQPFCGYQFAVVKATLPPAISFDLAGPGVDPSSHPSAAAITLDAITRWVWQENALLSASP